MLQKAIAKATRAAQDGQVPHEDAGRIQDELWVAQMVLRGHGPGGDLRKLLKQRNPWLLQLLLGAKTNVITVRVRAHICAGAQTIATQQAYDQPDCCGSINGQDCHDCGGGRFALRSSLRNCHACS